MALHLRPHCGADERGADVASGVPDYTAVYQLLQGWPVCISGAMAVVVPVGTVLRADAWTFLGEVLPLPAVPTSSVPQLASGTSMVGFVRREYAHLYQGVVPLPPPTSMQAAMAQEASVWRTMRSDGGASGAVATVERSDGTEATTAAP